MKRPELYQKTVDILVQAYFNDTLEQGSCCGCAIGNLIAAHRNIPVVKDKEGDLSWNGDKDTADNWHMSLLDNENCEEFRLIGYSLPEVVAIERAFENYKYGDKPQDEKMFLGLMNVIEVLDQIHENKDEVATTKTKQRFLPQSAKCLR